MKPKRVLIAEDEANIVEALKFMLRREGYHVEHAPDGELALARALSEPPDAMILDVMLPKLSGFDVLKALRDPAKRRRFPVVMLTAKGKAQDRRVALDIGADAFLTKPFSNAEVVAEVRRCLRS